MSGFIKKLFGALIQKPWEESQVKVDNYHSGQTFSTLSPQMSAVIVMFGVSTVLLALFLQVIFIVFQVTKIQCFF